MVLANDFVGYKSLLSILWLSMLLGVINVTYYTGAEDDVFVCCTAVHYVAFHCWVRRHEQLRVAEGTSDDHKRLTGGVRGWAAMMRSRVGFGRRW